MNTATTTPPAIRPSATDCDTATAATTKRFRQANCVSGNKPTVLAIARQAARTSCQGIVQNCAATSNLVWPKRIRPTAAAITPATWSAGSWPNAAADQEPGRNHDAAPPCRAGADPHHAVARVEIDRWRAEALLAHRPCPSAPRSLPARATGPAPATSQVFVPSPSTSFGEATSAIASTCGGDNRQRPEPPLRDFGGQVLPQPPTLRRVIPTATSRGRHQPRQEWMDGRNDPNETRELAR
jgi:hypothetical protein